MAPKRKRSPSAHQTYSTPEIVAALKAKRGLVSLAAKKLGCTPQTIYNRAKTDQEIADAIKWAREEVIDTGEERLFDAVKKGTPWAISMLLKTLGRDRGYVERVETRVGGDTTAPPVTSQVTLESLDLPVETRRQILEAYRKAREQLSQLPQPETPSQGETHGGDEGRSDLRPPISEPEQALPE